MKLTIIFKNEFEEYRYITLSLYASKVGIYTLQFRARCVGIWMILQSLLVSEES